MFTAVLWLVCFTASAYSFEEIRALGGSKPVSLKGSLEGIIVSDWRSDNMEVNPNFTHNVVNVGENLRTAYIQSHDGQYGFRLKFDSIYGNRLAKGDVVELNLDGCQLVKETDPERYTVTGLKYSQVEVIRTGAIPSQKRKHISELTPEDVYTYVTLEGVEFPKKIGGYINVIETSVQISDINRDVWQPAKTGWLPSQCPADCWTRLVMDDKGDQMYMLVNSTCGWRRNDMGVPQGVGEISGIVVHSDLPRFGTTMGPYSIRPLDRADIDMPKEYESSYETVVAWEYDYNRYAQIDFETNGQKRFLQAKTIKDDRVKAETGEGYVWTDSGAWISLDDEYDARHSFDGWKPARMMGARSYSALRFDAKAYKWFRFDASGKVVGYNGVYLETSTAGVQGRLYFDFSFVASRDHSRQSVDYPVEWKVSYSEDGVNFTELPQVYILRPIVTTNIQDGKKRNIQMHSEMAMGFAEYSVALPESLCSKEKIVLRLAPCSDKTAVMPAVWNESSTTGKASRTKETETVVRFGTLAVRSLK